MLIKKIATASVFVLGSIFCLAQKGIHKFGNIPMEEMEMTVYEKDSSASALVLLKTGQFKLDPYKFHVHKRIKILKQSGTDQGNITLRVPNKGSIRASTFNLENGEIVEYKLKRTEIYSEEITDGLIVYKLFFPNVKVGSIVEIEYSHDWLPFDWNFQELIPVKYNELLVNKSSYFIFDLNHYGSHQLEFLGGYHWVGRDIPAFKPEPMTSSMKNYMRRVEFELELISIPGVYYEEFTTSWDKVGQKLSESRGFGVILRSYTGFLNAKAKEIKSLDVSPAEKIELAYDYVRSNIEWNGEDGIYSNALIKKKFTSDHSGSVADINLSLVALLQKSGLSAYPVVLSTKENGILKKYKPSMNKLNYVVAVVLYGDEEVVLDAASSSDLIPGVLDPNCLNGDGWIVDKIGGRWISLDPKSDTFEKSFAQVSFSDDGECTVDVVKNLNLFDYLKWKENYDEYEDDDKYHRALNESFEDFEVVSYSSSMKPDKLKVREKYKLDITSSIEDLGDELILNPFVFSYDLENPFKSDERDSPVDLGYKYGIDRRIMIKLPENLIVSKVPEALNVASEDQKVFFKFEVLQSEKTLVLNYQILVADPSISPEDYPVFKVFYSLLIDKLNESVTLKKKT